jgi:signal transduction histidine kinase
VKSSDSRSNSGLRQRLHHMSIINQLLIGNSIVIIASVVIGVILSGHFGYILDEVGIGPAILSFGFGILLGTVANYWVIKTALRPLQELHEMAKRLQAESTDEQTRLPEDTNPDVRQLATTVNSMLDRLDTRTRQLQAISERLINAQEDERKRIVRCLHDDTGQSLSILIMNLERMESLIPAESSDLLRRMVAARKLATRTLEDLRNMIYGLRPTMLDDLGLARFVAGDPEAANSLFRLLGSNDLASLEPVMEVISNDADLSLWQRLLHHVALRRSLAHTDSHSPGGLEALERAYTALVDLFLKDDDPPAVIQIKAAALFE